MNAQAQLRQDAGELVELALRLRDLAAGLRARGAAPGWLDGVLAGQIMRCMVASGQLRAAAAQLERHTVRPALPRRAA